MNILKNINSVLRITLESAVLSILVLIVFIPTSTFAVNFNCDSTSEISTIRTFDSIEDDCVGGGGNPPVTDSNPIQTEQEMTVSISSSDTSITKGETIRLTWSSEYANTCTGTGFDTKNKTSGYVDVSPASDTNYSVQCKQNIEITNQCNPSLSCCSIKTTRKTTETRKTNNGCSLSCKAIGMVSIGVKAGSSNMNTRVCESTETRYRGHENKSTFVSWDDDSLRCYYTGQKQDDDRSDKVSTCYCGDSTKCQAQPYPYTPPTTTTTETKSKTAAVSVAVAKEPSPEPTANITVTPEELTEGDSVTIAWSSTNATRCSGNGVNNFYTGGKTTGSMQRSPNTSATYALRCTGPGGSAADSATVSVNVPKQPPTPNPKPVVTLKATPVSIVSGDSSRLVWDSQDATSCTGFGFSTGGNISGSLLVSPTATKKYKITCNKDTDLASADATVTVSDQPQVEAILNVSSSRVKRGETVKITWSSSNASSCTAKGIDGFYTGGKINGTLTVTPSSPSSQYEVTCFNDYGSDSDKKQVEVIIPPVPTVEVTATPSSINKGESTRVFWSSSNASSCSSNFSNSTAVSGFEEEKPTQSQIYTVTCTGEGGMITDEASVQVTGTPPAPLESTVSLTVSPGTITAGEPVQISWLSQNVNSCVSSDFTTNQKISGNSTDNPTVSKIYTIRCEGERGAVSDTARVVVLDPGPDDCVFNGSRVPHGNSVSAYKVNSVEFDAVSCNRVQERRVCTDGILSGSYPHGRCFVEPAIAVDFKCSKSNSNFKECAGVYTLVLPQDPIYVLADNTVENWYQCGNLSGARMSFLNLPRANNAKINFTFPESVKKKQFHEVSICLNSVNALDLRKDIIIKLLDFGFEEE